MELRTVKIEFPDDIIIDRVIKKITLRASEGLKKFGCSMWDAKMDLIESLRMAQEESMDHCVYIEKALSRIQELEGLVTTLQNQLRSKSPNLTAHSPVMCPCADCVRGRG